MITTNWRAVPIARSNATALAITALAMLFLAGYQPEDLDQVAFMRANALVLIAAHGTLHALTVNSLKFLAMLGAPAAQPALARYRDPRSVSHLDLAAAWLGSYALTPGIALL
jgi:hypothetical protein